MIRYTCVRKITDELDEVCDYILKNTINDSGLTIRYSRMTVIDLLKSKAFEIDNIKLDENDSLVESW